MSSSSLSPRVRCDAGKGIILTLAIVLAGCAQPPQGDARAPASTAAPTQPQRVAAPGEAALSQGVALYQKARYPEAEVQFKQALQLGLPLGPDRATAHKHLAFIYCTSRRESLCLGAFRAARQADPAFALSKAEAGHPMWGPVYRKAMAAKP